MSRTVSTTWAKVTAAYEDAARFIDGTFAVRSRPSDPASSGHPAREAGGRPDLKVLSERLCTRLDELRDELGPELDRSHAGGANDPLAPLMYLFDERIERCLAAGPGEDFFECPKLQHCIHVYDGGAAFYRRIESLIDDFEPEGRFDLELHLFCLRAGFQGRYFDNSRAIGRLKDRAIERLGPLAFPAPAAKSATSFVRPRRSSQYVASVAIAVVFVQVVLLALGRAM